MKKIFYVLTLVALSTSLVQAQGFWGAGQNKGKQFEKIDTNQDQKVSKAEMMEFHEKRFNKLDANNDGVLTQEEMKQNVQKGAEHAKEQQATRRNKMQEKYASKGH